MWRTLLEPSLEITAEIAVVVTAAAIVTALLTIAFGYNWRIEV